MPKKKSDPCTELRTDAAFLEKMADQLDAWAKESREGGWSTHQVEANRKMALECRARAGTIRRVLEEEI